MHEESVIEISKVIEKYFNGIFYGEVGLLAEVFHPKALLFGDVNGEPYFKTNGEYLEGVKNRKSPAELGETFRSKILALEIQNGIATARLSTPMFEYNYHDYLSLNRIDEKWWIVSKLFTHINF
jgi:hypothetical protein